MKATLMVLTAGLLVAVLAALVLETVEGSSDWIEFVAILLAALLAAAAGGRAASPRRRVRGFSRTPESDW